MDATLNWKNGLAFDGQASGSGYQVDLDGDPSVGGGGKGFRPMELMAVSVGGCTAMDVISILQKKRQAVSGFEVRVHTVKAEDYPKVWTELKIKYVVTGKAIDPAAVERAIQLSADKYCPAQNMLDKAVKIQHEYEIVEA